MKHESYSMEMQRPMAQTKSDIISHLLSVSFWSMISDGFKMFQICSEHIRYELDMMEMFLHVFAAFVLLSKMIFGMIPNDPTRIRWED